MSESAKPRANQNPNAAEMTNAIVAKTFLIPPHSTRRSAAKADLAAGFPSGLASTDHSALCHSRGGFRKLIMELATATTRAVASVISKRRRTENLMAMPPILTAAEAITSLTSLEFDAGRLGC